MLNKIVFYSSDGSIYYVDTEEDLASIQNSLPKGIKFKRSARPQELHNKYFSMVEELRRNTGDNINYTKTEYPEVLKPLVFKPLQDQKHLFTNHKPEYSTKNLTVEGYSALIEQLINVALEIHGYTFKNLT